MNLRDIFIEKEDLLKMKEELKNIIDKFKYKIKIIKEIFDKMINILDIYYKINSDIIDNYNINKRNYYNLKNINNMKNNNEILIKELNNIINNDNISDIYEFSLNNFYNDNGEKYIGEIKKGINPAGKKTIGGNKKEKEKENNFLNEAPKRNTIAGTTIKKHLRGSKSMGRLTNKPSLKKNTNKKKEKEMQKMVNNIKIDLNEELYNEEVKEKEEVLPPTLMTCHTKGILEKFILPFLNKNEQITLFSCNKEFIKLNISKLKDNISSYKEAYNIFIGETVDDKIRSLEDKYTQEELNEPIKKFELSRVALKAIGFLDDELYLRIFVRPIQEKALDEISIIFRIFCQFLGMNDLVNIKNDKVFWEKFSKYVLDNKGEKLSQFCNESANKFIFDDKNILKVKSMSKDINEKLKFF